MVVVPIAHDLVQAAAVHTASQAAHLLYPVTKEHGIRRKCLMVDVAVQRLIHSEDDPRHVGFAFLLTADTRRSAPTSATTMLPVAPSPYATNKANLIEMLTYCRARA
jgi:hypothetical protein